MTQTSTYSPISVRGERGWATRHRILLDGTPVFGLTDNRDWGPGTDDAPVFAVQCSTPNSPTDDWRGLLTFTWDSASYAGIGAAGFGVDGIFQPRPGIVVVCNLDDQNIFVAPERTPPDAGPVDLIMDRIDQLNPHEIYAALTGDDPHGLRMPDDEAYTDLSPTDRTRLLRSLRNHVSTEDSTGPQP